jgi:hypothetical protein
MSPDCNPAAASPLPGVMWPRVPPVSGLPSSAEASVTADRGRREWRAWSC